MIQRYLMMMIQFAGIHNGFRNKNHLDNIDIADTEDIDIVGIGIVDIEVAGEHMKAAYHNIDDNKRQLAEVQQQWR
jgi:hypothetical protein